MRPYYERDGITIVHADCIDVMAGFASAKISAIVTDPPYTAAGGSTNGRKSRADGQFFSFWLRAVLAEATRVTRPEGCAFLFCDWRTIGTVAEAITPPGDRQTAQAWTVSQALVWDRECIGLGSPFRNRYEMIAFARGPKWASQMSRDIGTVIRYRYAYGAHPFHGAEKPVGLCRQLIEWAMPDGNGILLDPFVGSGSTLLAARALGIGAIGIESDEGNCEIAAKRLEQQPLPLFDALGTEAAV